MKKHKNSRPSLDDKLFSLFVAINHYIGLGKYVGQGWVIDDDDWVYVLVPVRAFSTEDVSNFDCLKSRFAFWDETCLNCTYWKYGCALHYLPIIDPYFEQFYDENRISDNQVFIYHGCKDHLVQRKLLQDLKLFYDKFL